MATDSDGGGGAGAKMQRVDEQGDRREAVGAADEDRISALPDELRQRILTHLALKDAIRTGAVARGWRNLWRTRWEHRASVEIHIRPRDDPRRELEALESVPRRRLDRFSLIVETSKLKGAEFRRFTEYADDCRVEDLHVEMRRATPASNLSFHLLLSSPLLARLSLHRVKFSLVYSNGAQAQPFRALEVIRIHSIVISVWSFSKMMALCPSLLTLDLRGCHWRHFDFYSVVMPPNLRSITVANCNGVTSLNLPRVASLRSFRYSGDFVHWHFSIPRKAALADLYIQFARSVSEQQIAKKLNDFLPENLSGLNVLTICHNALSAASSLENGANVPLLNLNLHNLRELQLLMLEMKAANLADLYVFLKTCQCPNLEKLFVQLPACNVQPMEGSIDEVSEEPPEDGLDNLLTVKVMNFNWCHAEVQLVSFLLRKASSLRKLLIVSPNVAPLNLPGEQSDLLLLKDALANGKIMLSDSDDAAIQPYHSEVFIDV